MSYFKKWAKSKGFTQSSLSAKLKIPRTTLGNYYTGNAEIPADIMAKLRAMGYTGPANQREPAAPGITPADLAREMGALREHLDARLEPLAEGIRALMELLDAEKRLRESGHGGRKENER